MTPSDNPTPLSQRGSFALTVTIKNEARLLRSMLEYHLALGCQKVFVFLDGTTDGSDRIAAGIQNVVILHSVHPNSISQLPQWVMNIAPRWQENMDVRKRINTFFAARLAHGDSIEWIINLDPDELFLPGTSAEIDCGDGTAFFSGIPEEYDQVLMANYEVIPVKSVVENPFLECSLFLNRFPLSEAIWRYSRAAFRSLTRNPRTLAWYDYWFYRLRFPCSPFRLMRHPVTGVAIPSQLFLGYLGYKAAIRTESATRAMFNIHKWQDGEIKLKSTYKGKVLHYDLCDVAYMKGKFEQRNATMHIEAFHARYMIGQIATSLPDSDVERFFLESIAITDKTKIRTLIDNGVVVEITAALNFLRRLYEDRVSFKRDSGLQALPVWPEV
ncbi:MAG: glycosyltransferase family 2 protein [Nitrososphaera sp.]|nr:glycosyltransferase family 2 protein [Nitrososphaera sp.]